MARPIQFPEQTTIIKGGHPDVADLPAYRDGGQVISCWQFTPEEVIEIMNTGCVWHLSQGETPQPTMISGHYPFQKDIN